MRISLSVTDYAVPPDGRAAILAEHLARLARAADEGELDTIWVADHLLQAAPGSDSEGPMLEAFTTLAYLAARTTRLRVGAMVANASLRPAALLVKAVTTLDVLSEGRAWMGIGTGYHEQEAEAMGFVLPGTAERYELLEDTLQLAARMWSGDASPFAGARVRASRPSGTPPPVTRPHPPILIGGMGERRTLRLVARHADACNLGDIPDGGRTVRHKLGVLAAHCEEVGRPYEAIEKTVSTRLAPGEDAAAFAQRCAALAELGFDHVVVIAAGPWHERDVHTLAEAVPAVRPLGRNAGAA
jgi:alkanesulfonate monooxygenase SsuD/methylene tetrahydromethanopterin reductase-like flavin-dependent oxidoreductase (luciferase family)